jgi:RNA polymerase sigma factor (TIGR02999 family)
MPQAETEDRATALARLVPLFYQELRALARARLRHERPDHSLQATALVHEVYLRLLGGNDQPAWTNQDHFIVAAAEAMRRVLVDHARKRLRQKRGGDQVHVELIDADAVVVADDQDLDEILVLDEALSQLEVHDSRAADVVRLRYFAGLSVEETARTLRTSDRTVKREWAFARAWLYRALRVTASSEAER